MVLSRAFTLLWHFGCNERVLERIGALDLVWALDGWESAKDIMAWLVWSYFLPLPPPLL